MAFANTGAIVRFTYGESKNAPETLAVHICAAPVHADAGARDGLIATMRAVGPLDVFVYNAGVSVRSDILSINPDVVDRMINVNVRAPYYAAA